MVPFDDEAHPKENMDKTDNPKNRHTHLLIIVYPSTGIECPSKVVKSLRIASFTASRN